VAALGLAFYFARLGELRTLNWLLSTLLPYVVFALIVVFQSEIRHALANLGSRISLMRASSSVADVYDDIVLAANLFSQTQTGALIVIEREIGLRTYIESAWLWMPGCRMTCWQRCFVERSVARWRRNRTEGPHCGRRLFSAAVDEPRIVDPTGNAPPRGNWNHGRKPMPWRSSFRKRRARSAWRWADD